MTEVLIGPNALRWGDYIRNISDAQGSLLAALTAQQEVLIAGGVDGGFEGDREISAFLRTNPVLDSGIGRIPVQPDAYFEDRLFSATTDVLAELDAASLSLSHYGFNAGETARLAQVWHEAVVATPSNPKYPTTRSLTAALRAVSPEDYEANLNAAQRSLMSRYAEEGGRGTEQSLLILRRFIEIRETISGDLTNAQRLKLLAGFVTAVASVASYEGGRHSPRNGHNTFDTI